jgi:hypothetical protein
MSLGYSLNGSILMFSVLQSVSDSHIGQTVVSPSRILASMDFSSVKIIGDLNQD